ncbi:MAG: hemolysin family protein [Sandaracinaceae bacterium]
MSLLLAIVSATLVVSALCSLFEATLYSTRIVTLEAVKAEEGRSRRAAEQFLRLKKDVATPTSAILILNTIANTAGATFAGMVAADVLGPGWLPAFSAVLTLLILLFAEIVPKTYGAASWKTLWPLITWPLVLMVRGLSPLIWFTRKLSSLTTRRASGPAVTEDEIRATIRLGGRHGELSASELQMLEAVFHFEETTCAQVMVPRADIHFFDVGQPASSLATLWGETRHTRYPVCRGSLDDVLGMLHAKDLVGVPLSDRLQIEALVRPLGRVPESASISRVLREMQASHRQIVLVIDEFGSTTGLVTLKDILQEIVGALADEHEQVVPDITPTDDGYLVRGNLPLAKLNRELGLDLYEPGSVTLAGLLMKRLGRVLGQGDIVELPGTVAEVQAMAANRPLSIRLRMAHRPAVEDEGAEDGGA